MANFAHFVNKHLDKKILKHFFWWLLKVSLKHEKVENTKNLCFLFNFILCYDFAVNKT